jgi:O-acetylhomoserine (thiol)-lyase
MTSPESERAFGFRTRALHAGGQPDATTGARAVPIYQTTSYLFDDAAHAAALFKLQRLGYIYTRIMNPTTAAFEERMASLEGGVGALALATGEAARLVAIASLCTSGDEAVCVPPLAGPTAHWFQRRLAAFGIAARTAASTAPEALAREIGPKTRLLYLELLPPPGLAVPDIEAAAAIAHQHRVPLLVDGTRATPWLCRPIEHGADIVLEAANFLGGHAAAQGGVIVDSGRFPWTAGEFPQLNGPSPGYHGLRFSETFGELAYIVKCRVEGLRDLGPAMSPLGAFLLLQGLETLAMRVERHAANALRLARRLEEHPAVERVTYPGLASHPDAGRAERYLDGSGGPLLAVTLTGGREAAARFTGGLGLFSPHGSPGDPRSGTALAGEGGEVLIMPGLEDPEDLLAEVERALAGAGVSQ